MDIFLALNFHSERERLIKEELLLNKVMLLWALLVSLTLIVSTSSPPIQAALQITRLNLGDWPLIIAVSFIATFWMKLEKILKKSIYAF